MGEGPSESPHAGFPADQRVDEWHGYIGGKRWVVGLYIRSRDVHPGHELFDTIAAFLPAAGGQGVKTTLIPAHHDYDTAVRHGRDCLLLMGFEPL